MEQSNLHNIRNKQTNSLYRHKYDALVYLPFSLSLIFTWKFRADFLFFRSRDVMGMCNMLLSVKSYAIILKK